jgi:hypothetical protein
MDSCNHAKDRYGADLRLSAAELSNKISFLRRKELIKLGGEKFVEKRI